MSKRIITELPIKGGESKFLRIAIVYRIGGMNFFTGSNQRRGLYIDVAPITKGNGYFSVTAFSGSCIFVKEMNRFSAKTLATFVPDEATVNRMVRIVLRDNNIELEEAYECQN
jgi:hypothetical protein